MPASDSLLPYLRLVRAPAVFSALGDPLAGMLVARGGLSPRRAARAATASAALYLAGMALNDLADREEDARDRPDRPIPLGQVSPSAAAAVGLALLATGVWAARRAGGSRTGAALGASVIAYDFLLKGSPVLGPVTMGACRSLSFLMGAESVDGLRGIQRATPSAVLLGSYIAGLTVLARGETGERAASEVGGGAALAAAAVVGTVVLGGRRALPWAVGAVALAGPSVMRAAREPVPARVGPAVGALIQTVPALDGALAAPRSPRGALLLLPLLGLVRWGRRLFPIH